ncbi:MAG: hypothetical protein RL340_1624 [Gemmatimonadota bacterium]|jgi:GT2 family glycosyltransferase
MAEAHAARPRHSLAVPAVTAAEPVGVSIIIPTLDGRELLHHALRAVATQRHRDFEVIVVDNGSADGTREMLAAEWPEVRVVALGCNVGFAAAVNHGIRAARGAVVVLLNNDTEVDPDWLGHLVAPLRDDPTIASCASRVLDFEARDRIDSAGDQLGFVASQIGHGALDGPRYRVPRDVLSACAAAAAYRRDALEQIGGFDEWYVSYLEDVDVGVRLCLAGFRCRYVPEAVVYHRGSQTARRRPVERFHLIVRNTLVLFLRYMPPARLLCGAPVMLAMPFVAATRDGHSARVAWRALVEALQEGPAIVRHRARRRVPRVAQATFVGFLASPWTWQRRRRR